MQNLKLMHEDSQFTILIPDSYLWLNVVHNLHQVIFSVIDIFNDDTINAPVLLGSNDKEIILVTYDKCIFYFNDRK